MSVFVVICRGGVEVFCFKLITAFFGTVIISGCSVITTEHLDDPPKKSLFSFARQIDDPRRPGTFAYCLPETRIQLSIVQLKAPENNSQLEEHGIAEFMSSKEITDKKNPDEPPFRSITKTIESPKHSYVINFRGNPFFDDRLTLSKESNTCFLKQIHAINIDRSGDVLVGAVNAAFGTFKELKTNQFTKRVPLKIVEKTPLFDPHDERHRNKINSILKKFDLKIQCNGACAPPKEAVRGPQKEIYFRLKRTIFIDVLNIKNSKPVWLASYPVPSHNGSPLLTQKIQRRAFIRRETKIDLVGGEVTSVLHEKPSEAVGVVNIAGNLIASILAAPVAAFTRKTNNINAEKGTLAAQEQLLKQRTATMQAERNFSGQAFTAAFARRPSASTDKELIKNQVAEAVAEALKKPKEDIENLGENPLVKQ